MRVPALRLGAMRFPRSHAWSQRRRCRPRCQRPAPRQAADRSVRPAALRGPGCHPCQVDSLIGKMTLAEKIAMEMSGPTGRNGTPANPAHEVRSGPVGSVLDFGRAWTN